MPQNKRSKLRPLKVDQILEAKYSTINDDITLDLPDIEKVDFPFVSVITITKNRLHLFGIPLYSWSQIRYPENRIEWVVLDDGDEDLTDVFPADDKRIRYIKCEKMDIGDKRNKAVELAKHDYIVHMDDDDYYFPHSVLAKIRVMLHYNKQCVYSDSIGVYDIMSKKSHIIEKCKDVTELTMAYTRKFWETRKFGKAPYESFQMVKKREKDMIKLPFWFNAIACTHPTNSSTRLIQKKISTNQLATPPTEDLFPPDFKYILGYIAEKMTD